MQKADIILRSNAIFNGIDPKPFSGFVAVRENKILAVSDRDEEEYAGSHTQIIDLENRLICPGFTDVHCFFTGHLLSLAGIDLCGLHQEEEIIGELLRCQTAGTSGSLLLARNVKAELTGLTSEKLDRLFGERPVILFTEGFESCYMNHAAIAEFQFSPDTCRTESYWRLLKYLLNDRDLSIPAFKSYLSMLNERGITSIKEMGFDDFWGFTDTFKDLEEKKELTARVHFMSQPVGAPMNLDFGKEMGRKFTGNFVRFSGFNQMTDGSISQLEGLMKEPYNCEDTLCKLEIDWDLLESDALAADTEGFRFSLHAQGDGAIGKTIDIFEKCRKAGHNKLVNRHAITDLECADPKDLERMGQLGIVAEIYPQIMSLADRESKLAMIERTIGMERGKQYWNRRKMADSGVILSCGTDLPLLYDNIPESVYHAVGACFPEGGTPFNEENALTVPELLTAWTYGGQYNLGQEKLLGTLEAGKLADMAVLDENVFEVPLERIRDVKVCLTMVDGSIVYRSV